MDTPLVAKRTLHISRTKVELFEGDLVRLTQQPGEFTAANAREVFASFRTLAPGRRVRLLVDLRASDAAPSSEVQKVITSPESLGQLQCIALLASGVMSRMFASIGLAFLGQLKAGQPPSRAFTDEAEALAWLRSQGTAHA